MLQNDNIYLVGLMGVGKTTVGKKLANRLRREFIDTDQAIERATGVNVNYIFDIEGEAGFRARETATLEAIAAHNNCVVATGGGIVTEAENRRILNRQGVVVYLRGSLELLWSRVRHSKTRPLLQQPNPKQVLAELLKAREPLYRSVADHVVSIPRGSPAKTVQRIIDLIDEPDQ